MRQKPPLLSPWDIEPARTRANLAPPLPRRCRRLRAWFEGNEVAQSNSHQSGRVLAPAPKCRWGDCPLQFWYRYSQCLDLVRFTAAIWYPRNKNAQGFDNAEKWRASRPRQKRLTTSTPDYLLRHLTGVHERGNTYPSASDSVIIALSQHHAACHHRGEIHWSPCPFSCLSSKGRCLVLSP